MQTILSKTPADLGAVSAAKTAQLLNAAITERGEARLLLSTGASQFTMFEHLIHEKVDWTKVTMFHLDEYVNMSPSHPASFRRYLKERFVQLLPCAPKAFYFVEGDDSAAALAELGAKINEAPIDVGLIGIGENAHIAFNDPPANFDIEDAYIVVMLDEACRKQQFGEGWFPTMDDVPRTAVSMSCKQIMKCKTILSAVPYAVKANAVYATLKTQKTDPMVPATLLKEHPEFYLYVDADSAKLALEAGLIQG